MTTPDVTARETRTRRQDVPNEGDDGVFSQQWFPVCLSSEASAEGIHGVDFLDGRVVVVRNSEGVASVLSAFCAHLGVDLSVGARIGDRIQCPFHFWEYNSQGSCVATGAGDPPPRAAKLFRFPTREMYGIIFAFNGETPLYELPTYPVADENLVYRAGALDWVLSIDPWVISANTPDLAHITLLHDFEMVNDPYQHVEWTDHSMTFPVHAKLPTGQVWDVRAGIYGTNYFFQQGDMDGRWFGWSTPFGIPNPGQTKVYYIIAAQPLEGESPEDTEKFLDYALGVEMHIASQDMPVFEGIHYLPRNLTRSDRVLARFFEYVRRYPRAHPSAAFIR